MKDMQGAKDDRDEWRERVREIWLDDDDDNDDDFS